MGTLNSHAFRSSLVAAAALTCALWAAAQNAAPIALPKPSASLASLQIFPLSQVHRGLEGTAYTVLQGSTPEPIPLEVLGVLRNAIGPGKDMILARLTGAKAEYDGVVAGMSGSPVYIDGKLVGAIGYRIGQFTKQPIAGITPIQEMLDVFSEKDSKEISFSTSTSSITSTETAPSESPLQTENSSMFQPIATPLVFDGFSPAAIRLFWKGWNSSGMVPVAGLGGSSPDARDPAPVVPGSSISAVIVSGDFNLAATCTVTYVDPKHLLACGHPITRFGDVSLPMSKAVVVTTVASPLSPMKIVNTTTPVGSFTEDRESGILGIFGRKAPMIPVVLDVEGKDRSHTYHFSVAEHPKLTSSALVAAVYQAMQDTNNYNDPATYSVEGTIRIAGYPPVKIDERIAPTDKTPASLTTAVTIAQRFISIFSNPRAMPDIESVSLNLHSSPGRQSAVLADASVPDNQVHAGEQLTIQATLHPYRQEPQIVRVPVQLPATLTPGTVRLLVSDGTTLDHTLRLVPNPSAPPLSLGETIARLNRLHPTGRLYVTLLAPVPQAMLNGQNLPSVPVSMANVLQSDRNHDRFSIDGETAVPLASRPLNVELSGSRVITLTVRP